MLFHGNPYLIEGFNTFLPPGYHINASADPRDPGLITVTTPLGTMTSKISSGSLLAAAGGQSYYGSPHPYGPTTAGSRPDSPLARIIPPQTFSPAPQGLTTAVASVLGNMSNKTQVEPAPAAEFDHAIQYLNKIKTRYPDDQNNTYKQFLEILQTYRKEQQNSQKDPIGYQQREQRMMHDVGIFPSRPERKEPLPAFVLPRGGRLKHVVIGLYPGASALQKRRRPPKRIQGLSARNHWGIYPARRSRWYPPLSTRRSECIWDHVVA